MVNTGFGFDSVSETDMYIYIHTEFYLKVIWTYFLMGKLKYDKNTKMSIWL